MICSKNCASVLLANDVAGALLTVRCQFSTCKLIVDYCKP